MHGEVEEVSQIALDVAPSAEGPRFRRKPILDCGAVDLMGFRFSEALGEAAQNDFLNAEVRFPSSGGSFCGDEFRYKFLDRAVPAGWPRVFQKELHGLRERRIDRREEFAALHCLGAECVGGRGQFSAMVVQLDLLLLGEGLGLGLRFEELAAPSISFREVNPPCVTRVCRLGENGLSHGGPCNAFVTRFQAKTRYIRGL